MPIPSTLTDNFDAILTTTLRNYRTTLQDEISTANSLLFFIMKKNEGAYVSVENLGERAQFPLMYAIGTADTYSGYDQLDTTPMDGITSAFWTWAQMAVPVSISRLEERKNSGDMQKINLLEAKTKQALLGIQDLFGKSLLQGNGPNTATAITTPYTSNTNGATFIDPLPLIVKFDPTTSTTVGNINQSTYTWWRNQKLNDASSNYAGFLKNLRKLNNDCTKGPGGSPDLHVCDQSVYEYYEAALATNHRNPSYQRADIPFENIMFRGKPVTWDEFVPDISTGTTVQTNTKGTWFMLNTQFIQLQYDAETNFITTPFIRPENQDAKTAQILWYGSLGTGNRRKHGAMGDIDTTPTS